MIDPVVFIKKFGNRIFHAHAKDWELQKDILHIDGVTGDRLVAARATAPPATASPAGATWSGGG